MCNLHIVTSKGFSSVQSLSCVRLFATPWTAARQASLSITNSQSPPKPMSIQLVMPSNHLILYSPLLFLLSIYPSIRVFSNESALHVRWPKYWSFSFKVSPTNEHPGLISFRMDWLDLLAVQGTLKSLLQHHSSKASILLCSAFFIVQLSHPYMTTRKTIALTRRTFIGKETSLFFNMLSRFVITFLPRSKRLLISWLQSPSAVILEPKKIKSATVFIVCPSNCQEVMGPDAVILVFWMLSFQPTFSLSSFTFIKRLFSSSSHSAIRVVSSAYLRLLVFLPAILIPACASSSPAFLMMYSACKLSEQGDNIQPCVLLFLFGTRTLNLRPVDHDVPGFVCVCGSILIAVISCASSASPVAQQLTTPPASVRDPGSLPRPGRSPGGGNGHPLQYSCLGNPMDRGAWQTTVPGVTELDTTEPLSTHE